MMTKRSIDNVNITPEGDVKQAGSPTTPRSRKCLNLALMSAKRTPQSPLAERQNLPSPLRTPRAASKHQYPDSPDCLLSLSSSPSFDDEEIPSLIPKTPQPELRRASLPIKQISLSSVKTVPKKSFSIEKPQLKEAESPSTGPHPAIATDNFYSSGSKTAKVSSVSAKVSSSKAKTVSSKRRSSRGAMQRHRSKSTGGIKRKRAGLGFGGGHAIKKPKLTPKAATPTPVKISELPVGISVDLPASSSCYKTPKSSKMAKTSGQLSMSGSTKVAYELKGGKFVFRAQAKTPVRRSPRKHMSPVKAEYFSGSDGKRGRSRERNKLFSPTGNYLQPSQSPVKGPGLPSPVKFESDGQREDLSDLITSLANDQAIELEVPVTEVAMSSFVSSNPDLPDVSTAVNDILNDLSSGDESVESLPNLPSFNTTVDTLSETKANDEVSKLFPIFYKPTSSEPSLPQSESVSTVRRKFVCSSLSDNQTTLDAGQKVLGPVQCGTCGAVYTVGDPQEEEGHNRIHQLRLDTLKFPGWKTERKVGDFPAGRVICIKPGDHSTHWRKVEELLTVVDHDLGFSEVGIRWPDKTKVFLYIAEKKVVGVLLAERIEKGYRILPNNGKYDQSCEQSSFLTFPFSDDEAPNNKVYCCSETPEPVMCGISRIWVLSDFRRARVATSLVDCLRSNFYQNHYLADHQFAFSDPTMDGIKFASRYMKTQEFLVYSR